MRNFTIGVDVSKDFLDAGRLPDQEVQRFPNTEAGRTALLRWIGADADRVVFEPTGHYSKPLERALDAAGLPAVKVNPGRARRFAEASGILAKTDTIDALMLAAMGRQLCLEPRPAVSQAIEELKELEIARRAYVKQRVALRNRANRLALPVLTAQTEVILAAIESAIEAIDAEIRAHVQADPESARRADILESIPGLSHITAAVIIAEMPEIGDIDAKAAAALAGLAPIARQSGKWKGRAAIRAGRAVLRQALYMPALVAARFNPDLKRLYKRLREAGKPAKVALTAVMRKLIVLANTLIAQNRKWELKPA